MEDEKQNPEEQVDEKSICPECTNPTNQEELELFGGYCEDCATNKLYT
jgi:hypothetical protein